MGMKSRTKGKMGEREAADLLKRHGFEARRGVQYKGGADSQDLAHSMEGFHIEVKRVERFRVYDALEQAAADKAPGNDAVVLHRTNRKEWIAVMYAEDFLRLMRQYVYEEPKNEANK